jgi:hypothetical protein
MQLCANSPFWNVAPSNYFRRARNCAKQENFSTRLHLSVEIVMSSGILAEKSSSVSQLGKLPQDDFGLNFPVRLTKTVVQTALPDDQNQEQGASASRIASSV